MSHLQTSAGNCRHGAHAYKLAKLISGSAAALNALVSHYGNTSAPSFVTASNGPGPISANLDGCAASVPAGNVLQPDMCGPPDESPPGEAVRPVSILRRSSRVAPEAPSGESPQSETEAKKKPRKRVRVVSPPPEDSVRSAPLISRSTDGLSSPRGSEQCTSGSAEPENSYFLAAQSALETVSLFEEDACLLRIIGATDSTEVHQHLTDPVDATVSGSGFSAGTRLALESQLLSPWRPPRLTLSKEDHQSRAGAGPVARSKGSPTDSGAPILADLFMTPREAKRARFASQDGLHQQPASPDTPHGAALVCGAAQPAQPYKLPNGSSEDPNQKQSSAGCDGKEDEQGRIATVTTSLENNTGVASAAVDASATKNGGSGSEDEPEPFPPSGFSSACREFQNVPGVFVFGRGSDLSGFSTAAKNIAKNPAKTPVEQADTKVSDAADNTQGSAPEASSAVVEACKSSSLTRRGSSRELCRR
ncbi:unnamed protein product, partial [Amoebophrya sp. A120]|eukprot:GSA120T00001839001.1